jgi:HTH-type transcriptional regulator, competence development regulator
MEMEMSKTTRLTNKGVPRISILGNDTDAPVTGVEANRFGGKTEIERGLRNPPHPDILKRLAKAYDLAHRELLVAAGYLEEDSAETAKRRQIEEAYEHVRTDPTFKQGTRLKGTHVTLETKRFIVEIYEKLTQRNLLKWA